MSYGTSYNRQGLRQTAMSSEMLQLTDGNDLPMIGIGAFCMKTEEETRAVIKKAISLGVRHFEISELFGNGHIIVDAIRQDLERSQVNITYKIWPKERGPKELVHNCIETLKLNKLEYVDLLLLHNPINPTKLNEQWSGLEYMQTKGLAKSLGVCGYSETQLMQLLKDCTVQPTVVEMEVTPFNIKHDLVEFCNDGGIVVMNCSPVSKGLRHEHATIAKMAIELKCTPDELFLRWNSSLENRMAALLSPAIVMAQTFYSKEDLDNVTEQLSKAEMGVLARLDEQLGSAFLTKELAAEE
jgi:diketogulonate reductase-like aldo/keto reductase